MALFIIAVILGNVWAQADPAALAREAAELRRQGHSVEAVPLYERALAAIPANDPQRAVLLNNAAQCFQEAGQLDRAEAIARQALSMGAGSGLVGATARRTLGGILLAKGRQREALEQLQEAAALLPSADVLNDLALAYRLNDRLDEAAMLYERALATFATPEATAARATVLHNLGAVRAEQKNLKEAERVLREAVAIWEKIYGPAHPNVAAALGSLGRVLQARGDYREAERLLERALELDRAAFPAGHIRIGVDLKHAAALAADRRHYAKAEALLSQSIEILESAVPKVELGLAFAELGRVLQEQHRSAAAAHSRALALLAEAWGANDRRLLPILDRYVMSLREDRDFATAANIDLQATRIRVGLALR
jgi:tetratricopeptide (TPR) repeat protein